MVGDSVDMLLIWYWFWLGADFWFWLRFNAGFRVWFGGGICCFAAWPRFWALLFGCAPSMLAPILLPSCSFLMCLTTAVALKACCYTQTHQESIADLLSCCIWAYSVRRGCSVVDLPSTCSWRSFYAFGGWRIHGCSYTEPCLRQSWRKQNKPDGWNDSSCISCIINPDDYWNRK